MENVNMNAWIRMYGYVHRHILLLNQASCNIAQILLNLRGGVQIGQIRMTYFLKVFK